jgi:hypothetical protein
MMHEFPAELNLEVSSDSRRVHLHVKNVKSQFYWGQILDVDQPMKPKEAIRLGLLLIRHAYKVKERK